MDFDRNSPNISPDFFSSIAPYKFFSRNSSKNTSGFFQGLLQDFSQDPSKIFPIIPPVILLRILEGCF